MNVAASASGGYQMVSSSVAYAIPIGKALTIAKQIDSGRSSATVHVGPTAFLGVQVATAAPAATATIPATGTAHRPRAP